MRKLILGLVLALMLPTTAAAFNDPGDGGGGYCYWTVDHRFVCMP